LDRDIGCQAVTSSIEVLTPPSVVIRLDHCQRVPCVRRHEHPPFRTTTFPHSTHRCNGADGGNGKQQRRRRSEYGGAPAVAAGKRAPTRRPLLVSRTTRPVAQARARRPPSFRPTRRARRACKLLLNDLGSPGDGARTLAVVHIGAARKARWPDACDAEPLSGARPGSLPVQPLSCCSLR